MLPLRPSPARATVKEEQSESLAPQKGSQQLRHDDPQICLHDDAADADSENEASTAPAAPVNPEPDMPLALYRAPSLLPSEDLSSSGGPSLDLSTLSSWSYVPIRQRTASVEFLNLSLHLDVDENARRTPFEIESEGLSMPSTTVPAEEDPETPHLFPWKFEFRWEGGVLHSPWGPLGSARMSFSRQSIDISRATVGGSNGFSVSTHASTVLKPMPGVSLHTAARLEEEIYWAMREQRASLVQFLVNHYWRTHTSQGANRRYREIRPRFTSSPSSAQYAMATSVRHFTRGRSSRRLVNGGGSGSGEDDDPDDGDDPFRRPGGVMREQTRHFACPFQKLRPHLYPHCYYRMSRVTHVKDHLLEKHSGPRCKQCHRLFRTRLQRDAHQAVAACCGTPTPDTRVGYLSEQQISDIKKRVVGRSPEKQWRNLFRKVFPNEDQPLDVYLDRRAEAAMQHIVHDFERCCRHVFRAHRAERARDDPFLNRFQTWEQQEESVAEQFFVSVMLGFGGQDASGWAPTYAVSLESPNDPPAAVATGSSHGVFLPNANQNQSLEPGFPLALDFPRQNHGALTGLHSFPAVVPSPVPQLSPDWHFGSQFNPQPINLSDVDHVALNYQSMTTDVLETQLPVLPQPGQDFHGPLFHQPNNNLSAVSPPSLLQLDPHNNISNENSDNDGIADPVIPMGPSTAAWPPSVPGIHGFAPMTVADRCLYSPIPTNDNFDNITTPAFAAFPRHHMQWEDMGPITPALYGSSDVPYH